MKIFFTLIMSFLMFGCAVKFVNTELPTHILTFSHKKEIDCQIQINNGPKTTCGSLLISTMNSCEYIKGIQESQGRLLIKLNVMKNENPRWWNYISYLSLGMIPTYSFYGTEKAEIFTYPENKLAGSWEDTVFIEYGWYFYIKANLNNHAKDHYCQRLKEVFREK